MPTLLWFRVTGGPNKSQHCWAQQCWVRLHGPLLFYYTNTLLFLLLLVLQVTNSFRGWLCTNTITTSTDSNRTDYYYTTTSTTTTTTVPILYTIHHSHRHLHIYHFPYSSFMFATRTIFTTSFNVPSAKLLPHFALEFLKGLHHRCARSIISNSLVDCSTTCRSPAGSWKPCLRRKPSATQKSCPPWLTPWPSRTATVWITTTCASWPCSRWVWAIAFWLL